MAKKYEKITIESIEVDVAYQRGFNAGRARVMAQSLDWARFGVPVVSRRADGKLYAVDAQHRISAAAMAGEGKRSIMCEVHDGLGKKEEADLFLNLNAGRKAVSAYDRYKARMVAEEPIALGFTEIVIKCGLRIVAGGKNRNSIVAVQAVESVYRRNRNLEEVLSLLKEWGGGSSEALDGDFIKDFSAFLRDYTDDIDMGAFKERLAKVDPVFVMRKIKSANDGLNNRRMAANVVLRDIYNTRRSKASQLIPTSVELGMSPAQHY